MPEPSAQPTRIWWYVVIGFAICWMLCLYFFVKPGGGWLDNTGSSEPAVYDWSLVDLKDRPVSFSRFAGKTVFLNFWATWCGPCVREMPSIAKLAKNPRLRGKNIEFVCVSTDKSSETVRQFLESTNWDMTILRTEKIPSVYLTEGIPATFLISPDGRIAASTVGAADWDDPYVVDFLEKLARTPAPNKQGPAQQ
jgi:thiol-disulfide isomerase/thioredoxin